MPPAPSPNPNVKSKVWGPHAWKFIHAVTLGYPEVPTPRTKQKYADFFNAMADVLPCRACRTHFSRLVRTSKCRLTRRILRDRNSLVRWGVRVHNAVNQRKKKPAIPYGKAVKLYDHWIVKPRAVRPSAAQ